MLRITTLLFISLFCNQLLLAKCGNKDIRCLNKSNKLHQKGLIFLYYFSSSEAYLPDSNNVKFRVFLVEAEDTVSLRIVNVYRGDYRESEVVFQPINPLKTNKVYELQIADLPMDQKSKYMKGAETKFTFTLDEAPDHTAPKFLSEPYVNQTFYAPNICSKPNEVEFKIDGKDDSDFYVKATVHNIKTGKYTSFILDAVSGFVQVGGSVCGAAFVFGEDKDFEVVFQLMDEYGNKSEPTRPIPFINPAISEATPKKNTDPPKPKKISRVKTTKKNKSPSKAVH